MKTYLRCSIHVSTMTYPFKTPFEVQNAANELKMKCKGYEIKNAKEFFLIPIDTSEYLEVIKFADKYKDYFINSLFYVHKFTKKELEEADYLLLTCSTLVEVNYDVVSTYKRLCEHCNKYGEQVKNYTIKKNGLGKRLIAFSYNYRFIISRELKEKLQNENITNAKYISIHDKSNSVVEVYQLETEKLMPEIAQLNNWRIYKKCEKCGNVLWDTIQNYDHPLYLPKEIKNELSDINATTEVFTELNSRYIIISKKVYNIIKSMGIKKIEVEPIIFV